MFFLAGERVGDCAALVGFRAGISFNGDSGIAGFRMDFGTAMTVYRDCVVSSHFLLQACAPDIILRDTRLPFDDYQHPL